MSVISDKLQVLRQSYLATSGSGRRLYGGKHKALVDPHLMEHDELLALEGLAKVPGRCTTKDGLSQRTFFLCDVVVRSLLGNVAVGVKRMEVFLRPGEAPRAPNELEMQLANTDDTTLYVHPAHIEHLRG